MRASLSLRCISISFVLTERSGIVFRNMSKIYKKSLKKILKNVQLSFEELVPLLIRVDALVNSRHEICYVCPFLGMRTLS